MNDNELDLKEQIRLISRLTQEEKFCIDAYIVNGNKTLAYKCSRTRESKASNKATINVLAYKFFNRADVSAYVSMREQDLMNGNFITNKEYNDSPVQSLTELNNFDSEKKEDNLQGKISSTENELSKERLLQTLTNLFFKEKDTKLKAELGIKIADLQQWKKDINEKEDTTTKFYIPLKCFNCPLYTKLKGKKSNS